MTVCSEASYREKSIEINHNCTFEQQQVGVYAVCKSNLLFLFIELWEE